MAVLQRSTTLPLPVHRARRCWTKFIAHQIVHAGTSKPSVEVDPGTIDFSDTGRGTTEVTLTMQGNDEDRLNERVESYLTNFKEFAERQ